ncbi:MAG: sigma-70 family RNA polymerase sigma factor [Myxococcaceae bacterium]|nr:sigma-70 family RNA polymerase sigma factor [Myxococcaceae bacterium]
MELETVYRQHRSTVTKTLLRFGVPPRDVDDIAHEVFVVVRRNLPGLRCESHLRTWVIGICRKAAADYRRSARVRRELLGEASCDRVADDGPFDALAAREEQRAVRDAVARLPPEQRHVLLRFALDELTMQETAELARVPVQTAYARLYAGQRVLRDALSPSRTAHALA